jgi:hypothetical protein
MTHDESIAHEILAAALDQDLKADFPNARLGVKHPAKADRVPTIEERIGDLRADALQLVEALNAMQSALAIVKSKL